MNTNEMRNKIANMVHTVWAHNRKEAMDRAIAFDMLTSNFQVIERENGKMLYDNGDISEADFKEAQEYWCAIEGATARSLERDAILKIVNKLKW